MVVYFSSPQLLRRYCFVGDLVCECCCCCDDTATSLQMETGSRKRGSAEEGIFSKINITNVQAGTPTAARWL